MRRKVTDDSKGRCTPVLAAFVLVQAQGNDQVILLPQKTARLDHLMTSSRSDDRNADDG